MTGARCVPRRGRSRPRPARPIPLLAAPAGGFGRAAVDQLATERAGGFVQAAVDAYARTGHRPPWLSPELLAVLEARGRLVGLVYLVHFDRPIGDLTNPHGFAGHYTGTTASSGLLTAVGATQGGEVAELSPDRVVSLDQTPSSIRSSRLQLDRPVCQGAIDDLFGAQVLPVRRPEDEVAHIPGRARNVALDQVQPCLQVDRAALGTHELTDQVDQLISAQPLRHGAHDGRAGGPSPASGTGPPPGDIRRGEQRPASQHPHLRVHASRKSPAFPDDRAGIVLSCRESSRPAQARPTGHLACDTRRERQPYAATNCRHIQHWTLDLPGRLQDHAAGRGARLMEVVSEAGIGWQLARVWPGTRSRERSLKGSGGAARRCPVCQLTRLGLAPARPADLFAFEVGARAAACTAPPSEHPPARAA